MTACMPLSRKKSPIAQPENGARNCIGAGSEAVGGDDDRVFERAVLLENLGETAATVERFCPTATQTQ